MQLIKRDAVFCGVSFGVYYWTAACFLGGRLGTMIMRSCRARSYVHCSLHFVDEMHDCDAGIVLTGFW